MKYQKRRIVFLLLLFVVNVSLTGCLKKNNIAVVPELQTAVVKKSQLETRTYINTKYSFTFTYPKIFDRNLEHADSEGIEFKNEHASLMVFGKQIAQDEMIHLAKQDSSSSKYTVEQYEQDGYQYCYATKTISQVEITMIFRYQKAMETEYEEVLSMLLSEIMRSQ